MVRTVQRLKKRGVRTVIVDLQGLGSSDLTIDLWYQTLLDIIEEKLNLSVSPVEWWEIHKTSTTSQRFITYLHNVVLSEISDRVAIFIDEIDNTLNLNFKNDFFAAIRAIHNARAIDPAFKRLTFVLLGAASPSDLIKDNATSPFNIGYRINLQDLSPTRAAGILIVGLEKFHPGQGAVIFDRIYDWTNGHPFLTQSLCLAVAREKYETWTKDQVDRLVENIIFSDSDVKEKNLKTLENEILSHDHHHQLLKLYRRIHQGKKVIDNKQSPLHNQLKLSGLVITRDGQLQVRNEIYRQVFSSDWVKENISVDWRMRIIVIVATVAVVLALGLGIYIWQIPQPDEIVTRNNRISLVL